jgi:NADPH:quinone reductase-like Zn-dependent oxidoreductase
MKAVVRTRYGGPDVLRLADTDTPVPGDGQVLVKAHAVSLNASDREVLRGRPLDARIGGPFRPRRHVLGSDIAGRVAATGRNVTRFEPGDDVFADILGDVGGCAEYVCGPQAALAPVPAGLTFEQAAALPQAGSIAVQGIGGTGRVRPGQKVLINGGGGSDMYAVQLARLAGAEVTGVDDAEKLEFMRSLGADHVIGCAREDFTRNRRGYDPIRDLAAYRPASAYRRSLTPGGRYLYAGGPVATLLPVLMIGPVFGRAGRKQIRLLAVRLGVRRLDPWLSSAGRERSPRSSTAASRSARCTRRCAIWAKGTPRARSWSPSGSFRRDRTRTRRRTRCAWAARPAELALPYAAAVYPALADAPIWSAIWSPRWPPGIVPNRPTCMPLRGRQTAESANKRVL